LLSADADFKSLPTLSLRDPATWPVRKAGIKPGRS
jgi:hypothetical protein